MVFVINKEGEEKIKEEMSKVVPFMEPEPTVMDRMVKWLGEKIPLE